MGQTIRQTMPFNARYAFMQAVRIGRYSQQTRASSAKLVTYPSTIGVCEVLLISLSGPGQTNQLPAWWNYSRVSWWIKLPSFASRLDFFGAKVIWRRRPAL
jgi:hypothetical protein